MTDDKNCNAGKPSFLLSEHKQLYIAMQWKHDNTAPTPYCMLCFKEAWSASHFYSNMHLIKIVTQPYEWTSDWKDPTSIQTVGLQDPRTHGITFPSLAQDYDKQLPVQAHLPCHAEGLNVPQCEFRTSFCKYVSPSCIPEDTQMVPQPSRQPLQSPGGQDVVDYLTKLHVKFSEAKKITATLEEYQVHQQEANAGNEQKIQDQFHTIDEKFDAHNKSVMDHIMTVERRALRQQLELDKERLKSASSGSCWTKWFGQHGCWSGFCGNNCCWSDYIGSSSSTGAAPAAPAAALAPALAPAAAPATPTAA
jgi:hypothetical protein